MLGVSGKPDAVHHNIWRLLPAGPRFLFHSKICMMHCVSTPKTVALPPDKVSQDSWKEL